MAKKRLLLIKSGNNIEMVVKSSNVDDIFNFLFRLINFCFFLVDIYKDGQDKTDKDKANQLDIGRLDIEKSYKLNTSREDIEANLNISGVLLIIANKLGISITEDSGISNIDRDKTKTSLIIRQVIALAIFFFHKIFCSFFFLRRLETFGFLYFISLFSSFISFL